MSYISRRELRIAYEDCIKSKKDSDTAINFDVNESFLLEELYKELNTKNYNINKSILFSLFDEYGDPRKEVFAADFKDRIVHHLIVNRIVGRLEENYWISDSYSCRKGKGTLYGAKRLMQQLKEASNNGELKTLYIMKLDLKNCFNTFSKIGMYKVFDKFLDDFPDKNNEYNKWLIHKIMFHCPQDKGNYIKICTNEEWKSLPACKSLLNCDRLHGIAIGNLTSQVFANTFLTLLDRYIKETLGIKYYGRYVDDFYLISESKEELLDAYKKICEFLSSLELQISDHKFYIQEYHKGVQFIGYMIYYNRMYCINTTKFKFYRLVYNWNNMILYQYIKQDKKLELKRAEKIMQQWNSYSGMFCWVKGKKRIFENAIKFNNYFVSEMQNYFYFDARYMLKYKKETKELLNEFYLDSEIGASYEEIVYKKDEP